MSSNSGNPKKYLIRGALWTVGSRWTVKAIGFVNTIIMARILVPADYGIVAIGVLVVGLIETFLDANSTVALLRKTTVTTSEIDSAWTLRVIQGVVTACIVSVAALPASTHFGEPRLVFVLVVLSIGFVLTCASNIGQTLAQREFNYALDFKITVAGKLTSVLSTIVLGIVLHDYRALALGLLSGYIVTFILSYLLHPYRPRWDTSEIPSIWAITKWLLVANIGSFILRKGDELAASNIGSVSEYGLYNVGADLGQLPVGEVGPATLRALMPVLTSIQNDVERTKLAVLKTISALNTVIWPIGLGAFALAPQFTILILGEKWLPASTYVATFAVVATLRSTFLPLQTLLVIRGETKSQSHAVWVEFFAFMLAAAALVPFFHLSGLAYARAVGCIPNMLTLIFYARTHCDIPMRSAFRQLVRPVAGAVLMGILVDLSIALVDHLLAKVMVGVGTGAVFYTLFMITSWKLAGSPEGLESTLMDLARSLWQRRTRKSA